MHLSATRFWMQLTLLLAWPKKKIRKYSLFYMLTNGVFAEKYALNTYSVIKWRFMCFIWQRSPNFPNKKAYKLNTNPIFYLIHFLMHVGLNLFHFLKLNIFYLNIASKMQKLGTFGLLDNPKLKTIFSNETNDLSFRRKRGTFFP